VNRSEIPVDIALEYTPCLEDRVVHERTLCQEDMVVEVMVDIFLWLDCMVEVVEVLVVVKVVEAFLLEVE
jgi:hypothetical protein